MNLTPRQLDVIVAIRNYRHLHGYSPTMQELADQLGTSKVTIFEHVGALEKKRVLRRDKHKARSLEIIADEKLPDEDREKVASYLMRAKVGEVFGAKGVPPGTTIGQALDAQKKWEAEQAAKRAEEEALKKKLEQERTVAMEQLNKAVTVTLLAKQELPKNFDAGRYSEYQQFRIGVQNNSEKPVAGVAGEIKFIDVFDKEVGAVNFRITENIAPGKSQGEALKAVEQGAQIIRVHDVPETVQALKVWRGMRDQALTLRIP